MDKMECCICNEELQGMIVTNSNGQIKSHFDCYMEVVNTSENERIQQSVDLLHEEWDKVLLNRPEPKLIHKEFDE